MANVFCLVLPLVVGTLLMNCAHGSQSKRSVDEIVQQQVAQSFLDDLISHATESGKAHIDSALAIDPNGKLLSSAGAQPLQLTIMQRFAVVSAFASNRFDSFQADGFSVAGVMYRFMGVTDDIVSLVSRQGTMHMMKAPFGVVVAHSPKGGMDIAVTAMKNM